MFIVYGVVKIDVRYFSQHNDDKQYNVVESKFLNQLL